MAASLTICLCGITLKFAMYVILILAFSRVLLLSSVSFTVVSFPFLLWLRFVGVRLQRDELLEG